MMEREDDDGRTVAVALRKLGNFLSVIMIATKNDLDWQSGCTQLR
jgi:hypothetical protein